jgi:hypothetical protein
MSGPALPTNPLYPRKRTLGARKSALGQKRTFCDAAEAAHKGTIRKEAPALQLGLSVWRNKVSARNELNQPRVTTGAGALPLPRGALPTQAARPKAIAIEQITTNNFLIGLPL